MNEWFKRLIAGHKNRPLSTEELVEAINKAYNLGRKSALKELAFTASDKATETEELIPIKEANH